MAEVTNCTMEQLLQIHAMTNGWVATLPLVVMMINATPQSRTGRMPHEVAYGRKLRMPMDIVTALMTVPTTKEYVTRMQRIWENVRKRLTQQQARDAQWADRA